MNYPKIRYDAILPEGFDKTKEALPMIVFLRDLPSGVVPEAFAELENKGGIRAVVIIPKCTEGLEYTNIPFELADMIDEAAEEFGTDRNRISMTGFGIGGSGVWEFLCHYENMLSAAVPVSGDGMSWRAGALGNIPIWAFHGSLDTVMHKIHSQHMVTGINLGFGNARITLIPEYEHDIADKVYESGILKWMAERVRGEVTDEIGTEDVKL